MKAKKSKTQKEWIIMTLRCKIVLTEIVFWKGSESKNDVVLMQQWVEFFKAKDVISSNKKIVQQNLYQFNMTLVKVITF